MAQNITDLKRRKSNKDVFVDVDFKDLWFAVFDLLVMVIVMTFRSDSLCSYTT